MSNKPIQQFVCIKLLWAMFFLTVFFIGIIISPFCNTSFGHILIIAIAALIGILCIVSFAVNQQMKKAFESLKIEIDRVAAGDFDKKVIIEKYEDFASLADSLENMRTKLSERVLLHQEIATLYRISSVVNSILNLEELLKAAMEEVALAFKVDYGAIFLWNEGRKLLETQVFFPGNVGVIETIGNAGVAERVFQSGNPILESDVAGLFKSAIGAALVVKGNKLGAIELYKKQSNGFSENDLDLLGMVVGQIAMAVENAKLYSRISEDLQKRLDVLGGLYYASQLLSSSLHFQNVLEILADLALQLLFADSAAISILDDDREEHRLMAARGLSEEFVRNFVQRKGEGLGGRVIDQGVPMWVNDVDSEARFEIPQVRQAGVRAVLAVPIKIEDRSIGCIFASYKEPHNFQQDEVKLLTALANQSAIVIKNARLYSQILEEKVVLDSILYSVGDGVLTMDRDFRVTSFNRAAELITGWKKNEVLGLLCHEVFGGKSPSEDLQLALEVGLYQTPNVNEPPKTHEVLIVTKDGSSKYLLFSPSPLTNADRQVIGVVTIFKDVSRLKETEQMKTDFLTTVSHELRTPLTSIKGYIATLMHPRANFPNDTQQKFLGVMEREADRLGKLISDLLDVSKIESNRLEIDPKVTNLVYVIERKIEVEKSRLPEHYKIRLEVLAKDLLVRADVHYIEYVLEHLLSNAIKYSPDGGDILVSIRQEQNDALVSIKDWGIGIPFDHQDKIFDRFYRVDNRATRKAYGPGLGLFIAKRIVESHGGRIWVESVYKEGSTFTFSLPTVINRRQSA